MAEMTDEDEAVDTELDQGEVGLRLVKGNAPGRRRPSNKTEMVADVRSYR